MDTEAIEVPRRPLPRWLAGLPLPSSKDEALDWAERHGASETVLDWLEELPAAVFTTEEGLHHAFDGIDAEHPAFTSHHGTTAHDGTTS